MNSIEYFERKRHKEPKGLKISKGTKSFFFFFGTIGAIQIYSNIKKFSDPTKFVDNPEKIYDLKTKCDFEVYTYLSDYDVQKSTNFYIFAKDYYIITFITDDEKKVKKFRVRVNSYFPFLFKFTKKIVNIEEIEEEIKK